MEEVNKNENMLKIKDIREENSNSFDEDLEKIDLEYNELKDLVGLPNPKKDEDDQLITKSEKKEKDNLLNILEKLSTTLKDEEKYSINRIYEEILNNEDITKRELKTDTNECLMKFMFYIISPLFGIIFLIGVFQIISLKKALGELLKQSIVKFYKCKFKNDCNITNIGTNITYSINYTIFANSTIDINTTNEKNGTNVYNFFEYFYYLSTDETIDFNLMMITGFIGDSLLKSRGFRISTFILSLFNFIVLFWLLNFDFRFKEENVFDYDIVKLLTIFFIYILLLIGIGGSALLSQKILVDSHVKYKNHFINKKIGQYQKKEERKKEKEEEEKRIKEERENMEFEFSYDDKNSQEKQKEKNDKENLIVENINNEKSEKDNLSIENVNQKGKSESEKEQLLDENRRQKQERRFKNIKKNKFDFFFMICLTTTIAYFGKYSINLLLKYILKEIIITEDKKYFFYFIVGIYFLSILFSIFLYSIFICIFNKNYTKIKEEVNKYNIFQICGYIIYTQKINLVTEKEKPNCFKLFCESANNCCNEVVCKSLFGELCEFNCICCYCYPYIEDDYEKNKEFFCYCYQAQRKSFWCNKFITNKTQKTIFPYMIEYFLLQLTTIALEIQYEKYKSWHVHIKTYILVFLLSFILFIYFTISFSRFFSEDNDDEINEHEDEQEKRRKANKELISKLSNEILNGTFGIYIFNGIFSLLFSYFYFSDIKSEFKEYVFENNINIIFIPILMNKFYYFTLNYYCTSTSEDNKQFEFISSSTLISLYIGIWDIVLFLIKFIISTFMENNLFLIFYYIQIFFAFIPSFIGFIILIFIIGRSFDCWDCFCCECNCPYFELHKFLFCFISFILCFGGLWIKFDWDYNMEYECCCNNDNSCDCDCCECLCCDRYTDY